MSQIIAEVQIDLSSVPQAQAQIDALNAALENLEGAGPRISDSLNLIGGIDLSNLLGQFDTGVVNLTLLGSAGDTTAGQLAALGDVGTAGLGDLGSVADTTAGQLQALGATDAQPSIAGIGDVSAAATGSLSTLGSEADALSQSLSGAGASAEESRGHTEEASASWEAGGEAIRGLGEGVQELAGEHLPGLSTAIGVAQQAWDSFNTEAESGTEKLAAFSAGAAATGIAVAGISFHAFESGLESLHLTAEQSGLTTQAVAGLTAQMAAAGLSGDTANAMLLRLNMGLQAMQNQVDAGKEPTGKLADAFKALGVNAVGADGQVQSLSELMPVIADGFKAAKDGAEETGTKFNEADILAEIFGRKGAALIPIFADGSKGLKDWADKADGIGTPTQLDNLEKYHTASASLGLAAEKLGITLGSDVAPAFTAVTNIAGAAVGVLNQLPGPVRDLAITVPLAAAALGTGVIALGKVVELGQSSIATLTGLVGAHGAEAVSAQAAAGAEGELAVAEDAAAVSGRGLTAALGPLGIAVAVGAAVGTGAALVYEHFAGSVDTADASVKLLGQDLAANAGPAAQWAQALHTAGATDAEVMQLATDKANAAKASFLDLTDHRASYVAGLQASGAAHASDFGWLEKNDYTYQSLTRDIEATTAQQVTYKESTKKSGVSSRDR